VTLASKVAYISGRFKPKSGFDYGFGRNFFWELVHFGQVTKMSSSKFTFSRNHPTLFFSFTWLNGVLSDSKELSGCKKRMNEMDLA